MKKSIAIVGALLVGLVFSGCESGFQEAETSTQKMTIPEDTQAVFQLVSQVNPNDTLEIKDDASSGSAPTVNYGSDVISIDVYPSNGYVQIEGETATYTPLPNWSGIEKMKFHKGYKNEAYYEEFDITIEVLPSNDAPTIGGAPATEVRQGSTYSFTPTAYDSDGDGVSYSITNKPDWATFNTSTGTLSGTANAPVGTIYSNVTITAMDSNPVVEDPSSSMLVFDITIVE